MAASLKAGIVAPSVMLRKLAAYRRQNQLDLALQELERIERTLFMREWLESPELRRRGHAGLNKSEQRHFLAHVICTFKQGRQTRPANKAGLPTAVPRRSSFVPPASTSSSPRSCSGTSPTSPMNNRCPMHGSPISPLSWEHISFSGDFLWERAAATGDKRRPLNLGQTRVAA